jgi:G patch domain/KOW motif-containing protein
MDPPSGSGKFQNGSFSSLSSGTRTSSLQTSKLGAEQEIVDEITSIGPSGIVGYENYNISVCTTSLHHINRISTLYSSRETRKRKQLVIPLLDNQFGESRSSHSSVPPELLSSSTDKSTDEKEAVTSSNQLRKDPFEGKYGLIATASGGSDRSNQSKAPMLARSRPKGWRDIEDEEERLKFELAARPETDASAFERVPIEDFGNAMLLGMGWRPGENDGAKVLELVRRPERLGLGATAKQPPPGAKKTGPHLEYRDANGNVRHVKPIGAKLTSTSPFLPDGTRVTIIAGTHEGMAGRIRRLSTDETEYIIELDNDEQVRVRLKEVERFENSKKRTNETSRDRYVPDAKRYKDAEIVSEARPSNHREELVRKEAEVLWVTPFIRVKVQSKSFRNGKYYCKKGVIEDIISGTRCAVRLDDGQVVDDIDQSHLETVIPPIGGRVMVVRGPDIGVRGSLREKDLNREVVYVQIEDELDVAKFNMDDVSEYVD